jgi:hypothetical protein
MRRHRHLHGLGPDRELPVPDYGDERHLHRPQLRQQLDDRCRGRKGWQPQRRFDRGVWRVHRGHVRRHRERLAGSDRGRQRRYIVGRIRRRRCRWPGRVQRRWRWRWRRRRRRDERARRNDVPAGRCRCRRRRVGHGWPRGRRYATAGRRRLQASYSGTTGTPLRARRAPSNAYTPRPGTSVAITDTDEGRGCGPSACSGGQSASASRSLAARGCLCCCPRRRSPRAGA